MKNSIKNILVLVCICAVVSLILAVTNAVTAPLIAKNEAERATAALQTVMPESKNFEKIDISTFKLPATVTEAYRAENGGYVLKMTTAGYSSGLVIMCGVLPDGTVSGAVCLSSTETLGYEKTFGENFKGKDSVGVEAVDTISGATKTTGAYRSAIKDALNAAIILSGGEADIRTEEEILADTLSALLPDAKGRFEKLFIAEVIEGVDTIYQAVNETGFVCVIGDTFIALDRKGNVISEAESSLAVTAETAVKILIASEVHALALIDYEDLPSQLVSAKKTASGNYIFEMKAAGYGVVGGDEYHPASGKYILIRLSMTKDGKIIDCLTLFEEETDGVGSACAEEWFYSQFDGKTEENYNEVDAISRATITTNGYIKAIERAFEALKIFEKGEK